MSDESRQKERTLAGLDAPRASSAAEAEPPTSRGRILAVDDHPSNLELVEELLGGDGFTIECVTDGAAALAAVARQPPDCVVLDVMMPGMDGFEVCRRLKADRATRYIPVVMLTALSDVDDKIRALDAGAADFLNKPVVREELIARVSSLVRVKHLHDELDTSENIIFSTANALENKLPLSAGHAQRVTVGAVRLARALALSAESIDIVGKAARLHDLGKIGVPEHVLERSAASSGAVPWSADDEAALRRHVEVGERILQPLRGFAEIREIIRHHHERLDGSGYPDGVSGDDFTSGAEVVALVNWFEDVAATSGRAAAAETLRAAAAAGKLRPEPVELFLGLADAPLPEAGWQSLLPALPARRCGSILVADDSPHNREILVEVLGAAGHWVTGYDSGRALLDAVAAARPDLVILDVRMPGLDGVAVCRALQADPATELRLVILVTADRDPNHRRRCIAAGASDFLPVPLHRAELLARVSSLLRLHQYFVDLEEHQAVILSLATCLEAKDPYTHGHSERVGQIARALALELGLLARQCELMRVAGLLHDIGKIGVPERLLNKPGPLTDDEFQTIMTHPPRGEVICRPLHAVRQTLPLIKHHHERFDGSGYPDHLAGEAIPLGARVLAVADAFDALTSERSYRKRLEADAALAILARETVRGLWDPAIFTALQAMIRRTGAAPTGE